MSQKKIEFLHIIGPDTKNSYGIMNQLHKHCDLERHKFLISAYDECRNRFPKLKEFDDLMFIPCKGGRLKRIIYFYKMLNSAEHIIWHSLFFTTRKYLLFLYFFKKFQKKSTWIEWGADLYEWEYENPNFKQKIWNHIGRQVRVGFENVGLIFPTDKEIFIEQFGDKPNFFYTPMCNPYAEATGLMDYIDACNPANEQVQHDTAATVENSNPVAPSEKDEQENNDLLYDKAEEQLDDEQTPSEKAEPEVSPANDGGGYDSLVETNDVAEIKENLTGSKKQSPFYVQVAHNSFFFNNHIKILNNLEPYKDENIKLFIPLAYGFAGINGRFGGKAYPAAVEKYAKEMYGNKVYVMTKGIPFDEYVRLLWTVDAAVFDFDRPCGLGNIRIMLYMGKKIFLPAENAFYKFLTEQGIKVYDANKIPEMTYEEFSAPVEGTDLTWIKDYMNNDSCIKRWLDMFDKISENSSK